MNQPNTTPPLSSLEETLNYLENDKGESLERLMDLVRIPSISTDSAYREEVQRAYEWLRSYVESMNIEGMSIFTYQAEITEENPNPHPILVAKTPAIEGAKHLLFYGHYDVQPADGEWTTPAFEPQIVTSKKGSKCLRGRGTTDDKGQTMTFLEAIRAMGKTYNGKLPVQITLLLEGEEETGIPSMRGFLEKHKDDLKADMAFICDTSMWKEDIPTIVSSLRGTLKFQFKIKGPNSDGHSGIWGGGVVNPIHVLSSIINDLCDEYGQVKIPGFAEDMEPLPKERLEEWEELDFDLKEFCKTFDLSEPPFSGTDFLERTWAKPSCTINGIWSGYTGMGFKTVLPSEAFAKISFRLPPGADPEKCSDLAVSFINERASQLGCTAEISDLKAEPGEKCYIQHDILQNCKDALYQAWGNHAAQIGSGGSIPIVGLLKEILGIENRLLIGFGKDDDNMHAPDEKYDLTSYEKGKESWARILNAMASAS